MNVEIKRPVAPPPTIILELTVPEFAALEVMRFRYLAGTTELRTSIDSGFYKVMSQLREQDKNVIEAIRPGTSRYATSSREIQEAFE